MKAMAVALILLWMNPIEAKFVWSPWLGSSECARTCSQPFGAMTYRRSCFNCSQLADPCEFVSVRYCDGMSMKTDTCYVATYCNGEGLYVGEWTEWSSPRACPPANNPCTGVMVTMERRCLLPTAFPDRSRPFQCPGEQKTSKPELCPCGMSLWSGWSDWSACRDPCGKGDRMRRRRCEENADGQCEGDSIQIGSCPVDRARCEDFKTLSRVKRGSSFGTLKGWIVALILSLLIWMTAKLIVKFCVYKVIM